MSRTRTDFRLTYVVLCAGVSAFSMLQSMVNPVLPTIQAALGTDQRTVTWLLTAYLLSASVFTPIVGRIGDKVGKERMLVVALGALAVGSLIAALAPRAGGEAPASLDPSASLSTDLKLDSLGRVELLSALEDRYQIEIDEASFTAATTVGEVERIVSAGGARAAEAERYPYPAWAQAAPVRWFRVAFYYAVVLPITSLLCWTRVVGRENLRELRGPVLFVSNHITYFDHALIMSALPGRFRRRLAIAQEGERLRWWRRPPAGTPLLRRLRWQLQYFLVVVFFNTFSLPQKSGFRRSFAYAGASVDRGYSVLVFPEGTRSTDGRLCRFMGGAGLLATKLDAPVVPVYIQGLYELKQSGRRGYALPGSVTIVFGEPVKFGAQDDPAEVTREIERRVAALAE